jgi:hypothetical protein
LVDPKDSICYNVVIVINKEQICTAYYQIQKKHSFKLSGTVKAKKLLLVLLQLKQKQLNELGPNTKESTMLQFIERNLLEVLLFSLFFGMFFTISAGYLLAMWIFG